MRLVKYIRIFDAFLQFSSSKFWYRTFLIVSVLPWQSNKNNEEKNIMNCCENMQKQILDMYTGSMFVQEENSVLSFYFWLDFSILVCSKNYDICDSKPYFDVKVCEMFFFCVFNLRLPLGIYCCLRLRLLISQKLL